MTSLPIKIKRLQTAKSLRLRVMDDGQVVVTCPPRVPGWRIEEFITENYDWILKHHGAAKDRLVALTAERSNLLFRGKELFFKLNVSTIKIPGVNVDTSQLIVTAASENDAEVRGILEKWYRKQAEKRFKERVKLLADLVSRDVITVSIRSQRTRWGSCSSRKTISLNWRLIMAPDWVSDYVIYHELAHLTHMNHSSKFWNLVAEYCPKYKEAEIWLKKHHQLLKF